MRRLPITCGVAISAWLVACGEPDARTAQDIPAPDPNAVAASPGELVELADGRDIFLNCSGEGPVAVILNSGLGVGANAWSRVQPDIAAQTTVCSFNHAGYAPSDPGPFPRDARANARDIRSMMQSAGIAGPYILVGQARGAQDVRMFAELYRDEVAGMVLVDPEIDDETPLAAFSWWRAQNDDDLMRRCMGALAEGRMAPGEPEYEACGSPLPDAVASPAEARAILSEMQSLDADREALREAADLGRLPLVVLTAGNRFAPDPEVNELEMSAAREIWRRGQSDIAAKSEGGLQIIVPGADRNIHVQRPEAVIDAILSVLHEVTGQVTA